MLSILVVSQPVEEARCAGHPVRRSRLHVADGSLLRLALHLPKSASLKVNVLVLSPFSSNVEEIHDRAVKHQIGNAGEGHRSAEPHRLPDGEAEKRAGLISTGSDLPNESADPFLWINIVFEVIDDISQGGRAEFSPYHLPAIP